MPITLTDNFWKPRRQVNARRAVYHQWQQLEASGCIENFRIAAGESGALREGWFFADSDAYKWLEAAARVQAHDPQPELQELIETFIALLGRAQMPDGYLFTYNQIFFPGTRWVVLQIEHELYCHGHLIEAGVTHYETTGETHLLDLAVKAADRIASDFQPDDPRLTPGHEEIEIALLRLYMATRNEAYREMTRQFLERRGRIPFFARHIYNENRLHTQRKAQVQALRQRYLDAHPGYTPFTVPPGNAARQPRFSALRWNLNALRGWYAQQHAPIRQQTVPVGHAVRFGYLETAAAMLLHLEEPGSDPALQSALEQAWERMVTRRMYVTGGIGSLAGLEGFGADYALDPEYAYAETCAALASMFWSWEMADLTHRAAYADLFEWQLYNAASVGMGLDGDAYLYNNPLAARGGVTRKPWFAVPCCPSNLSRTWANLEKYIYSQAGGAVWVHQYIANQAVLDTPAGPLHLKMDSNLPWDGRVRLQVDQAPAQPLTLHLRLPAWSLSPGGNGTAPSVRVNSATQPVPPPAPVPGPTASGYDPRPARYLALERTWQPGDLIELDLPMPIRARRAHYRVKGHRGQVALTRGPLVYCLESIDNPGLDLFDLSVDLSTLRAEHHSDLLGGATLLHAQTASREPLTFIPYPLWANRGESHMTVWVSEKLEARSS